MNKISEIIKQAQKFLFCPVCNRSFIVDEIVLRGFFDNIYILETKCAKEHSSVSMTVIIGKHVEAKLDHHDIGQDVENTVNQSLPETVSETDVNNLGRLLENFNGNFELLWKK